MSEETTKQLFSGIIEVANQEAQAILEKSSQDVELIASSTAKRIEELHQKEEEICAKRIDQIKRMEESALRNLGRKYRVSLTERLRKMVIEKTVKEMSALIGSEEYRHTLAGWIAEGAIGLGRPEAVVNCSFKEKIDEEMLREAEALVKRAVGKEVKLKFGGAVLTGQGVEVASLDGKIAYNNQVVTRLIRYDRELNELMEGEPCRKE
ncbi:MAG: V-type ATP synthase subunit E family protein [Sphaerochaetaceae bacterium]|jgi:vacuolar-type H+-ATPase subunit E/Vma4|nr:V-type ATP synthase subunit E family protein [Sphaerochaetaceae bacterium]